MDRLTFLKEECESVGEALKETLRYDYTPHESEKFFDELRDRLDYVLAEIKHDSAMAPSAILQHMKSIAGTGSRVSMIERSHLGEFSWPFAEAVREIAERLFVEENLFADDASHRDQPPLVHVVSEGMDYKIVDDDLASNRRILIVAFPRQLKHHVLLHALFGHELGHPAAVSDRTGKCIADHVLRHLRTGVLADSDSALAWLKRADAPEPVKWEVAKWRDEEIAETIFTNWSTELFCDLFGLKLFGPAFAAAHRAILEPLSNWPAEFEWSSVTHPAYPIRSRLLARAIKALRWDRPVTGTKGPLRDAEAALLRYAMGAEEDAWFDLFDDAHLDEVLKLLEDIFSPHERMAFSPPAAEMLKSLVGRLSQARPPISHRFDDEGRADNDTVPVHACLYAGWTFWFGRDVLLSPEIRLSTGPEGLSFLRINQLCEQAILQQRAIDMVLAYPHP